MSDKHDKPVTTIERIEPGHTSMSPVVAAGLAILERNPSPETLRELLAVQREYEANEARKAYATAQVALKRDLPTVIEKDAVVDFTSAKGRTYYRHSSLAGMMDAVTQPLTQHGFSLTFKARTEANKVYVTARLTHSAGHFEETTIDAPVDTTGSKSPAQGVASTMTLLQRYAALSLLGIATADMTEPQGEGAVDLEAVNSARNLTAVGVLKKYGKTREGAETFLGRKVPEWTEGDLQRLKTWMKANGTEHPGELPPDER